MAKQLYKAEIHHVSSKNTEPQKRKQSGFDSFLPESSLPLAQTCLFTPQGDDFPRPKAMSGKIFSNSETYAVILTNGGDGEGEMGRKQDVGKGTGRKGAKEAMRDYIDKRR